MPMPMPPPPPNHPQRRDSLEDALSLGQGAETKPLASVPKASSTPRRQYITSLVSELDFGSIPGLGPAQAAATPAQDSAATAAPAATAKAYDVALALPLHPAPASRKPKPALVPSFDFSQLPDYAGPAQSISVEPQPKGGSSFQASSSSSADALSSPPQPQPRPPQLPPRQSKAARKSAAGAGEHAATVGSKSAAQRASPVKGSAVMQPGARQPEARHAATAAERPKEGGRQARRQGGGGLDFLARLELVEQQEAQQEQHIPRSTEAPAGATVSPRPKPALEASTAGPSALPPLPVEAPADQLSQPLRAPLGRRFTPPLHSASPKPPGAATAKGASKDASSSAAKVPQRSQSAAPLRSSGVVHPFMRSGSGAASAASAASAARAASATTSAASVASAAKAPQERKASPAAGARQHGVIGKGGPAAAAAKQNSVTRKGGVAASAKQGSIDGRNSGLAAGASGAGRGTAGGGRGSRPPVERVASSKAACKAAAQPSGAPKRPSLAQSMGSGGEPSGSGSVPQKRQSSAAIPNGKHPKQKTTL